MINKIKDFPYFQYIFDNFYIRSTAQVNFACSFAQFCADSPKTPFHCVGRSSNLAIIPSKSSTVIWIYYYRMVAEYQIEGGARGNAGPHVSS